jgi:hypothetical protein
MNDRKASPKPIEVMAAQESVVIRTGMNFWSVIEPPCFYETSNVSR